MNTRTLFIPLALSIVLAIGVFAAQNAYAENTIMGCPENYYSSEFGCQITPEHEYVPETGETVEYIAREGCPEHYFSSEFGCQLPYLPEYSPEYALVGETPDEAYSRGCPPSYFEPEKGCQLFP